MNSTYFKNVLIGNIYGSKKNPALPANYYIGLSSTAPKEDGTGITEVTGGGYARKQMTSLSEPVNGAVKNTADISFPRSTAAWSTAANPITHYVIYDALTAGNFLCGGSLVEPRIVQSNSTLTIETNGITLTAF